MEQSVQARRFKRCLAIAGWVLLAAFFAAIVFRIVINDYFPPEICKIEYSEELTEYYRQSGELPSVYTQALRAPYSVQLKEGSNTASRAEGSFFANALIWIPDAENMQITVRYNTAALEKVEKFYRENGYDVTVKEEKELFTYHLTASYYNEDTERSEYKSYPVAHRSDAAFAFYRYERLVFDGVAAEDLRWVKLDIYLSGCDKIFGSVVIYEAAVESDGVMVEYDLIPYAPGKDEVPQ